jgi:hypothetical protein
VRRLPTLILVALGIATVGAVALAADPAGHVQTARDLLAQADAELEAAIAEPLPRVTVTTTETVTASPAPSPDPSCQGVQVPAGTNLAALNDGQGQTYCLAAGTYDVPATVQLESDTVVGAGRDQTFIVGTGAKNLFSADSGAVWEFRSLDISGGVGDSACAPDCGRAFVGTGESLTLYDIRCHDNDNQCVGSGAADLHFVNNECDHNGTLEFAAAAARSTACIKRIRGASTAIVTEVRDSFIHDNIWSGVWFDFYEGQAVIEGNTITGNGKAAIQWEVSGGFNAADNLIVRGNTIQNNGRSGITTTNGGFICNTCADVLIENNIFGQNGAPSAATKYIVSTREWGNIHGVIVRNNTLNGDALTCPNGVTCSGNA